MYVGMYVYTHLYDNHRCLDGNYQRHQTIDF